jgi:8-oxo-dGTP diphosphatase
MSKEKSLEKYDVSKYIDNATFQTADAVLMSVIDNELGVLLIKRTGFPYVGHWALPGGFLQKEDIDVTETARRELSEETGLDHIHLEQLACFSKKHRDPAYSNYFSGSFSFNRLYQSERGCWK